MIDTWIKKRYKRVLSSPAFKEPNRSRWCCFGKNEAKIVWFSCTKIKQFYVNISQKFKIGWNYQIMQTVFFSTCVVWACYQTEWQILWPDKNEFISSGVYYILMPKTKGLFYLSLMSLIFCFLLWAKEAQVLSPQTQTCTWPYIYLSIRLLTVK